MTGSDELIKEILDSAAKRDTIAYGMKQRALLEPSSKFVWTDPRMADGLPILAREKLSSTDLNQRIHIPFDKMIITNKAGYFASDIQITYGPTIQQNVKDFYTELQERSRWKSLMMDLANNCVMQGTAYVLCFLDGSEFRVSLSPTSNTEVVYNPLTNVPMYGIRYNNTTVEFYDGMEMTRYTFSDGIWMPGETVLHGMGTVNRPMVPIVEFKNSPDRIGNPERTVSAADAYDVSLSDLSNELAALRLSYLLVKGLGEKADVVKQQLVDAGVIIIDSDNGDARFVTKNINPEAVRLIQDTLRAMIFEGASSYDPDSFEEGEAPTAFQVSQRLHGLEMDTTITTGLWDMGFRQFDYLIQTFLMTFRGLSEYNLHEIDRIYRRTAPRNILAALVEARNAGMILSNQTLIELSGLQIDSAIEEERLKTDQISPIIENNAPVVG